MLRINNLKNQKMTKQKNSKAEVFCGMFQFQGGIYNNALEGLSEKDALGRVLEKSNHTNWLLGHVLHCRYMLANMLGVQESNPFGKIYWGKMDEKNFPSFAEVTKHFPVISIKLIEKLSSLTDTELDAKPTADKPSLTEIISFFVYHEAYHIGQIGLTRKLIGLEPLKSN
jgi:uncharacterized damage-inducible protein DinB